jgi:hypothetical protein
MSFRSVSGEIPQNYKCNAVLRDAKRPHCGYEMTWASYLIAIPKQVWLKPPGAGRGRSADNPHRAWTAENIDAKRLKFSNVKARRLRPAGSFFSEVIYFQRFQRCQPRPHPAFPLGKGAFLLRGGPNHWIAETAESTEIAEFSNLKGCSFRPSGSFFSEVIFFQRFQRFQPSPYRAFPEGAS